MKRLSCCHYFHPGRKKASLCLLAVCFIDPSGVRAPKSVHCVHPATDNQALCTLVFDIWFWVFGIVTASTKLCWEWFVKSEKKSENTSTWSDTDFGGGEFFTTTFTTTGGWMRDFKIFVHSASCQCDCVTARVDKLFWQLMPHLRSES